jgi:hypothetical protein
LLRSIGTLAVNPLIDLLNTSQDTDLKTKIVEILSDIDDPKVNKALKEIAKFRFFNGEPKKLRIAARMALEKKASANGLKRV